MRKDFDTQACWWCIRCTYVYGPPHVGIGHNLGIDQTDDELAVFIGDYDDPSQVQ